MGYMFYILKKIIKNKSVGMIKKLIFFIIMIEGISDPTSCVCVVTCSSPFCVSGIQICTTTIFAWVNKKVYHKIYQNSMQGLKKRHQQRLYMSVLESWISKRIIEYIVVMFVNEAECLRDSQTQTLSS